MTEERIGFIGGGNMARSIVAGLLAAGSRPGELSIAEPAAEQRRQLGAEFPGVAVGADNMAVAAASSCLVLAVKPQVLRAVCGEIAAEVRRRRPLIVSIAAGVRSTDIGAWLGGNIGIVRVMPNQPALMRRGVSGLYANEFVDTAARDRAHDIMASVGKVVTVPSEADIDAVTAVSGSGPAYFYLLIAVLEQTARQLGLADDAARLLALETAVGATAVAAASDEPMDALIARVRSPGGTTAAALDSLDAAGVRDIFSQAISAARDRAIELADRAHEEGS